MKMVSLKRTTQTDPSLPNLLKEDRFLNSGLSKSRLKSIISDTNGGFGNVISIKCYQEFRRTLLEWGIR